MTDIAVRVELFLAENPEIDDTAKEDFRACSNEVQEAVLSRGELSSARNKSAALITRIRDGRAMAECRAVDNGTIEEFIAESLIDEKAAEALRASPVHIQEVVIARGKIEGVNNPSSCVMARIRDASRGGCARGPTVNNDRVEEFIAESEIDEQAAATLRASPGHVQQVVIARGKLGDVKNPSSVVMARIRDANRAGASSSGGMGGMDPSAMMSMMSMMMGMMAAKGFGKGKGKGWGPY